MDFISLTYTANQNYEIISTTNISTFPVYNAVIAMYNIMFLKNQLRSCLYICKKHTLVIYKHSPRT